MPRWSKKRRRGSYRRACGHADRTVVVVLEQLVRAALGLLEGADLGRDGEGGDAGWGRGCDRESARLDEKRYLIDSCLRLMGKRCRVIWLKGKERLGARCKTDPHAL